MLIEDGAVSLEKIALYSGLSLELKKELQLQMAELDVIRCFWRTVSLPI